MLCLVCSIGISAQTKSISGVVKDAAGEAVIGAGVIEVGTQRGTLTDMDGKFVLTVSANAKIKVSYVGFQSQIIDVKGRNNFIIQLKEEDNVLNEVVVTGYGGKQLRTKVTSSISKVKEDVFTTGLFSNPAQALSGAVAGVRVQQSSGNPGSTPTIILRGGTDYDGSGSPLVVVDGQIRASMSDINPEDIESMEVLKDAGATAIYGARANNGVVLITTKRGKAGSSQISLKAKVGLNYYNNPYEFMHAGDYLYWQRTAIQKASQMWKNAAGDWQGPYNMSSLKQVQPYGTGNKYWADTAKTIPVDGNKVGTGIWGVYDYSDDLAFLLDQGGWAKMTDPVYGGEIIYKDTDVASLELRNPAVSQDYNISLTGGNDKGSYYASIGYNNSQGNAIGNWYKRLTFVLNADYKIKPWLTSSSSLNFADAKWYGLSPKSSEGNYFSRAFSLPPTFRGYNANGELLLGNNSGDGNQNYNIDKFHRDNNTDKFTMVQAFDIKFMEGLNLKLTANWLYSEDKEEAFDQDYLNSPGNYNRSRNSSAIYDRVLYQTYNAVLNYNKQITKDHYVAAMLGFEYYDEYDKGFSASGSGAPSDDFSDLQFTKTDQGLRSIDSWHTRQRIMSFFGRLNYDFQSKYLFSFVFRRDGYSRLAKDNRWGFFPGVTAGWVFGKEKFMESLSNVVSFAKLRVSYGVNGNVNRNWVGDYTVQGAYGATTYNGSTGYLLSTLPNPYLKWEKSNTFEVGLDLSFLQNKINTNFTYYNRLTSNKFATIPLPVSSGVSGFTSNNGKMRNSGLEMEMSFRPIETKDWKWNISVNAAYNVNKVVALPYNGLESNRQGAFQVYSGNGDEKIWVGGYQEGQTPGDIYAYQADGLYRSDAEVPGNLVDISIGNNGSNNKPLYGPTKFAALSEADKAKKVAYPVQAGDVKWRDVNGDGTIDQFDRVKVGNSMPKWTGGINTSASWKDLTLSVHMDFALGFKIVDWRTPWIMGNMQGTYNSITDTKDTWTVDNPNAKYPTYIWADQLGKRNYARDTSMFIYNGNYLSFREISLSYRLPKLLVQKLNMANVEFSVTGQNLGYLTAAKHVYTPEVSSNNGGYPLPRTVVFGVNVTF